MLTLPINKPCKGSASPAQPQCNLFQVVQQFQAAQAATSYTGCSQPLPHNFQSFQCIMSLALMLPRRQGCQVLLEMQTAQQEHQALLTSASIPPTFEIALSARWCSPIHASVVRLPIIAVMEQS
jgi:hypothetical protein